MSSLENQRDLTTEPFEALLCQGDEWFLGWEKLAQEQSLLLAYEAFREAVRRQPEHIPTWHRLGRVCACLGATSGDGAFFMKSDEAFHTAEKLLAASSQIVEEYTDLPRLYWDWGKCWWWSAQAAGESSDLSLALNKFSLAETLDSQNREGLSAAFWCDCGDVWVLRGKMINNLDAFAQAMQYYQRAIMRDSASFRAWRSLAEIQALVYRSTALEEDFQHAQFAFQQAEAFCGELPYLGQIYLAWAALLINSGEYTGDLGRLERAIEQLSQEETIGTQALERDLLLAHAYILLGAFTENLDLLRTAEEKLSQISQGPVEETATLWYLQGICLNELGFYFSDSKYCSEALERFRHGLNLDSKDPWLWYGSAFSLYMLAGDDGEILRKAVHAASLAVSFQPVLFPQFWNRWGQTLLRLAEATQDGELVGAAVERFEQAINLRGGLQGNPDLEWLYNYGCALDYLGDFSGDERHYQNAVDILACVVRQDPVFADAQFNLAVALVHLGEASSDIERLQQALEYFERIIQQDPEDDLVLEEWGNALIALSRLVDEITYPESAHTLLGAAEEKLQRSAALGNTQAFYALACLYSLSERFDLSVAYLYKAHLARALPKPTDLLHDEWLEGVRTTPAFQQFIQSLETSGERGES